MISITGSKNSSQPKEETFSVIHKKWLGFKIISLLAICGSFFLLKFKPLEDIESRTWDWRLQHIADQYSADPKIKIILVEQSSLDLYAKKESIFWPWPREIYVPVIKYLEAAQAKGVAFDIIFTEDSSYGVDDDITFTKSFSGKLPVVSAVVLSAIERDLDRDAYAHFIERAKAIQVEHVDHELYQTAVPIFQSIILPINEVVDNSAAFGNVSAAPDADGIFRHFIPAGAIQGTKILSLPFSLYNIAANKLPYNINDYVDADGKLVVRFQGGRGTYETYKIEAIIDSYIAIQEGGKPLVDPAVFNDSFVFLGLGAPGLFDLRPTPLSQVYPGVEFNATVLDNLIHQRFIKRLPITLNLLIAALFVFIGAAATIFFVNLRIQGAALSALIALLFVSSYTAAALGYWIDLVVPLFGTVATVIASYILQYQLEGRQYRFIKSAFKQYVSPAVIEEIIKNPAALSLGGEKRELTIFFSDIKGFTSISESLEATQLVTLLNTYLNDFTAAILNEKGTVDKYVGDAVVAFWNAPLLVEDHAQRAVRAAVECQKFLELRRDEIRKKFNVELYSRIGLHTGIVNVGNFGSDERFNYTVIGDGANLASRLEGANKYFGTSILLSEATHAKLNDTLLCRKIGDIKVVGRENTVAVYEPLYGQITIDSATKFNQAREFFEKEDLLKALELFRKIENDPVSVLYANRIETELKRKLLNWRPVWDLVEK